MTLLQSFRAWRGYHKAIGELDRMSDRELSDLGITRGQIRQVVRRR